MNVLLHMMYIKSIANTVEGACLYLINPRSSSAMKCYSIPLLPATSDTCVSTSSTHRLPVSGIGT